jgi:hypothetical protein
MGRTFAAYRVEASLVAAGKPADGIEVRVPEDLAPVLGGFEGATLVHCEMRRPLFLSERGVQLQQEQVDADFADVFDRYL